MVSRDVARSERRANLSRYLAAQYDLFPKIVGEETNLFDPVRTAELINRHRVFAWVAEAGLPTVANGDFHAPEHVDTWKTLLPCPRTQAGVVSFLRSEAPAALTRVEPEAQPEQLRETA